MGHINWQKQNRNVVGGDQSTIECIYLVEQQKPFMWKTIKDWLLSDEKILTVGDGDGNIPEEKNSAIKLLM